MLASPYPRLENSVQARRATQAVSSQVQDSGGVLCLVLA